MSTKNQNGFTLVEVAIVAPLMIIITIGLIALLIGLVNSIAVPTKQNVLVNSGENAFDAASSDIKNGSGFLASVPAGFNDPNSSDYASPPANTEVLYVQGYNQLKDPTDTTGTRTLPAFKGPSPCNSSTTLSKDNVATIISLYFVKNGTLWRRVLTESPAPATCATPLLIKQTCSLGQACSTKDTPLAEDSVTEFKITYYTTTNGMTIAAVKTTAKSVLLSIKGSTPSASSNASYASKLRVGLISD